MQFEYDYAKLISSTLLGGEVRNSRNGTTFSLFGTSLNIYINSNSVAPILQGRKMRLKGILGEFKTFMAHAKTGSPNFDVAEFEANGCNYWKDWAEAGKLVLNYGSEWNRGGQLDRLVQCLNSISTDRRMIISSWRSEQLLDLSLPCCHHTYQFYVREGRYLDIQWLQRSADLMLGVPSDIILAWLWLVWMCKQTTSLIPGRIQMIFGDTHVYAQHKQGATEYVERVLQQKAIAGFSESTFSYMANDEPGLFSFDPTKLVFNYESLGPIKMDVLR